VGRVGDGDNAIHEDAGRDDRLRVQLPGSTTSATWTIVTLPAIAIGGPKFRAVLL
jgi:hypothetical protein